MNETATPIMVALSAKTHEQAKSFAAQQITSTKRKQVYFNTLAVCAVQTYLSWLGIEADLEQSESWQISSQLLSQPTDLLLPSFGRLECCPVLAEATELLLPWDAHVDSLACVAVQFDQSLEQAALLGFLPLDAAISSASVALTELRSLDELLRYLAWIEAGRLVRLRQWLENNVELGWQELARRFRSQRICCVKQVEMEGYIFDLQVQIEKKAEEQLDFLVRLSLPQDISEMYLPENLQLRILDAAGAVQLQRQAAATDRWLEEGCLLDIGEQFQVQIELGSTCMTENFVA